MVLINCVKTYCSKSFSLYSFDLFSSLFKGGINNQSRGLRITTVMAHSKWEYVKTFETEEKLLPNCWAVARIDGKGFHKLAKKHNWKRPNDERGLQLMTKAAKTVMNEYNEIVMAYGQSDEYSFIFRRDTELYQRRSTKIITTLVAKFSSAFVYNWKDYFPDVELQYPPSFDGRMVLYPTDQNLRDYLCWRQADCHINNLYNTTFWALVLQGGMGNNEATKHLSGTLSGDKNEILFSRFNINYNNEPEIYRKGTVLVQPLRNLDQKIKKKYKRSKSKPQSDREKQEASGADDDDGKEENKEHIAPIIELNCDIIGDSFWEEYPYLLDPQKYKQSKLVSSSSDSNSNNQDELKAVQS